MFQRHLLCPSEGLCLLREGPPRPQGSAAWLRLTRWLMAIAELWKVKWHFELGIFELSIKLKMIAEDCVNPSRVHKILSPVTSPGKMG